MLLIFLLAGAVVPLLITPGLFFHYDTAPKAIILALAAALALVRFRKLPGEMRALWLRRPGRWLMVIAAAQLVWFAITSVTSSRPWFSVFGSGWRRFGLVEVASLLIAAIVIAGGLASRPERVRSLLRMIVCAGVVASLYGIFQYFGVDPLQPAAAYQAHAGDSVIVRPPGTMGHADYFGWWLAIEFFCAIALARIESSFWKHASNIAAVCIFAATVLSGTRAALLALMLGGLGMLVMSPTRAYRRQALGAALALVLFAGFLFSPAGTRLRARVVWSGDEPAGGARPLLWRDSLRMAGARPLVGFGPETYLSAFALYQSEELSRQFPDFHHESPHNLLLDALTSMGIPGLLLVAAWVAMARLAVLGAMLASSPIAAPLTAALIASATAAMFSAASPGPLLLIFLVMGILIASCTAATTTFEIGRAVRSLTAVVAVVVAVVLLVFSGRLGVYEFRLERFSLRSDGVSYQSLLRAALPGAGDDLYASRKLQLECQLRSDFVKYVGCIQQTLGAAARALRTEDDLANAWYSLAMLSAAQNELVGTRRELVEATRASPHWFKPHWALARVLAQAGERDLAATEAARAALLDANRDAEVVQTVSELTARRK